MWNSELEFAQWYKAGGMENGNRQTQIPRICYKGGYGKRNRPIRKAQSPAGEPRTIEAVGGMVSLVLCVPNSRQQIAWLAGLDAMGVRYEKEGALSAAAAKATSLYDLEAPMLADGGARAVPTKLSRFAGRPCLVVNVASA